MKLLTLLSICLAATFTVSAQTYVAFNPSLTNSAGTWAEKANLSVEIGRQWDVFSLGLDIGKTTLSKVGNKDTSLYWELRPNLNIFQQGKFTNTITAGIGYIFNANENFVTEITSGIEYSYSPLMHFNIYFGQYFYSGELSASNVTFFGVSIMRYFTPVKNSRSLITNNPQ